MGLRCGCPAGAALPDIENMQCKESLGQVQKLLIQRTYKAAGEKNTIESPETKASWTTVLSAKDSTKVVVTPYVESPETEPGAKRTVGGGNASLGGIAKVIGREPTTFTSTLNEVPQRIIASLKKLQCEEISVAFVDEYGRIGMWADDPKEPTSYGMFPISGFFIGDKKLGGIENLDSNALEFSLFPNWSDNLVIVEPDDFNALDLANVEAGAGVGG